MTSAKPVFEDWLNVITQVSDSCDENSSNEELQYCNTGIALTGIFIFIEELSIQMKIKYKNLKFFISLEMQKTMLHEDDEQKKNFSRGIF